MSFGVQAREHMKGRSNSFYSRSHQGVEPLKDVPLLSILSQLLCEAPLRQHPAIYIAVLC